MLYFGAGAPTRLARPRASKSSSLTRCTAACARRPICCASGGTSTSAPRSLADYSRTRTHVRRFARHLVPTTQALPLRAARGRSGRRAERSAAARRRRRGRASGPLFAALTQKRTHETRSERELSPFRRRRLCGAGGETAAARVWCSSPRWARAGTVCCSWRAPVWSGCAAGRSRR